MNDLNKSWKDGTGADEKKLSRRPMWRSLKVVTNANAPVASSKINSTIEHPSSSANNAPIDDDFITASTTPEPASIKIVNDKKTRLSSWLSQQLDEHERQTLCSPSWTDDRDPATMSNLSLVSHASSINAPLLQPVDNPIAATNNTTTPPLSPVPAQPLLEMPITMIYPPSATSSTVSDHSLLTTPAILDDHSFTHSFGTLQLPDTTSITRQEENDDDDDDDDDDDTYTTASGTNSYMDNGDNTNQNNANNNNETGITSRISMGSNDQLLGGRRLKHRTSSMQALYVNSIMDAMDSEVAQVLLEWRRQSLLNIDWFDLFSVKSDIWRSSTIFPSTHLTPPSHHQLSPRASSHSSIATSLISLDFKGIPLEKAFRSYSDNIDYAKASVLDIDQALKVFAQLYWECNPNPLFRCAELVYIVIHSLMLSLTDIHAGHERMMADDFCNRTIALILDHQTLIPLLPVDTDNEHGWQQSMMEYLQSLYKSFSRSTLLPLDQPHLSEAIVCYQQHHHHRQHRHYPNQEPRFSNRLETAFDNMFINTNESLDNRPARKQPQKKQKRNRRRRSKSMNATPSWTLVRRRDTLRAKVGPYKEGPLSCQLDGEEWNACWVILHLGHLYVYHHKDKAAHHRLTNTVTTTSSVLLETSSRNRFKQKFMHHITSASSNISPAASLDQLKEKATYQVVDIYLGNAFCEKIRPHAFLLQLINGKSYVFDCGSEHHVAVWIQDCNYWAARETKIVLSRGSAAIMVSHPSLASWKRPPPPAGASVLDKKGQQEAIDTHLLYLQTELDSLLQYEPSSTTLPVWLDKRMYLELEIRKYQCYQDSIV